MAIPLDSKDVVGFEELLMSQVVQQEALTRLLVEKGIFSKEELLDSIKAVSQGPVIDGLKILQRIYQISPTDEAMEQLLSDGINSATDIASMERNEFVTNYAKHFISYKRSLMSQVVQQEALTRFLIGKGNVRHDCERRVD
jgi:hypothetical protein